jgi:hypothetical protein
MNQTVKRIAPKVAKAVVRGPLKRLMDRRAAKGGRLVLWWRRTFGELELDGNMVDAALAFAAATKAFQRGEMTSDEYAQLYVAELERQKRER